jgi:predicted DNA-binding transcriptional regulator AlpA
MDIFQGMDQQLCIVEEGNMETRILRPRGVAKKIGIGESTFWRWLADPEFGMPQGFRMGRARCWKEEDIEKWLKKMEKKGAV